MSRGKPQKSGKQTLVKSGGQRSYVSQADIPSMPLESALKVANAIADNYAAKSARPVAVAQAMGVKPTSSGFRMVCGASIAYGLTDGGYNAPNISVTALGKRIVAPTQDGDDLRARREAVLRPRLINEFLRKYDGSKLPRNDIAHNVLTEMGVPRESAERSHELILENAEVVGFLRNINGTLFVDLEGTAGQSSSNDTDDSADSTSEMPEGISVTTLTVAPSGATNNAPQTTNRVLNNRVFVTHGKNKALISHIKDLLSFGRFEPIVSIERESVSKPIPDKVMDDMRSCGAAIIHVDAERELMSAEGERIVGLNENVLIEIGAAMALYKRRFVLLVKEGVSLPSNLAGLYEVRYNGDKLDGDATLKLLKAFNDLKIGEDV